ncbi:MAG: Asp-tRNA(Asn)/Glu-tRNA(Gln) amidotransferase subunit GatC [Thaumarchaeota archaeon]|nr:Asp-tRNA(Asn)/Glu-tRNA(Gln) amidotransferase subunit GatC [Nitrososphaerota archaeon]
MKKIKGISKEQVRHLAWLAKIDLSAEEEQILSKQIADVLDYFRVLDKVDTKNIEPAYLVRELRNVFRQDTARKANADEILKLAPTKKGRYVKAPKIV